MKLALGLDVQTNAKGGKFMSIEDSRQGALVCKADVEVLWEPGNFQDDGAKRVGVCFASNTDLELWTEEVEQGVIDNMIVFQKPFPGAARTELESQLQRAVKVSAKGKHVKCKMDLERCLFSDPAGNRVPRPAEFARRRGRALGGAPPHAGAPGGAVLPVLGNCVARPGGPQQLLVLQPHAVVQPHSVRLHFRHGHKNPLGYLPAGPNARPHPHALRAVLCYTFITPTQIYVDDFQL